MPTDRFLMSTPLREPFLTSAPVSELFLTSAPVMRAVDAATPPPAPTRAATAAAMRAVRDASLTLASRFVLILGPPDLEVFTTSEAYGGRPRPRHRPSSPPRVGRAGTL